MPSWHELQEELVKQTPAEVGGWLDARLQEELSKISELYDGDNVIYYCSAFLQKPNNPHLIQITSEDLNGWMSVIHGMDSSKGLSLILHTPGGATTAVETIVDYLHKKFEKIRTIVPLYAMSGGTMICLASDEIIMGKQSQLGPIDPQMISQGKTNSARAVVDLFKKAKEDIENDTKAAHLWAPILQSLGPSLLVEAQQALSYSEHIVGEWLKKKMFKDNPGKAISTASKFNAESSNIYVHGQRINADMLKEWGLDVQMMENKQNVQEAILTAYHISTLIFEYCPTPLKMIVSHQNKRWIKNQAIISSPPKQNKKHSQ